MLRSLSAQEAGTAVMRNAAESIVNEAFTLLVSFDLVNFWPV
jgi:hypothetical protein